MMRRPFGVMLQRTSRWRRQRAGDRRFHHDVSSNPTAVPGSIKECARAGSVVQEKSGAP